MSDTLRLEWKKVDKGMKEKVLRNNDTWKTLTEEKQIAFCKYLKEKKKIVQRLAKLLESNIPTFGDSVRQHLRNFCNDDKAEQRPKSPPKKGGNQKEEGSQWTTQANKKSKDRERNSEKEERGAWADFVHTDKTKLVEENTGREAKPLCEAAPAMKRKASPSGPRKRSSSRLTSMHVLRNLWLLSYPIRLRIFGTPCKSTLSGFQWTLQELHHLPTATTQLRTLHK